ncbi:MAG: flagellar biosynthetic protein FliO [Deltaproteobacteria bacterium]|nr:flagellar biosynthetic protein FliO [Deltaproteobacteria bacterium]
MEGTPDFAWLFIKMIAGLILVLALAIVLIRYVLPRTGARWGRRPKDGWVRIVDRFALEPRKSLYLVKIAERYLVLGTGEGSLSLIQELTAEEGGKIENGI